MTIKKPTETLPQSGLHGVLASEDPLLGAPVPGLALVYSGLATQWAILPLPAGEHELGRDSLRSVVEDGRISRRHASVKWQAGKWFVKDHGSRNGTASDGRLIRPEIWEPVERCLRVGESLFLPLPDVRPLRRSRPVVQEGRVLGPRLMSRYLEIARTAAASCTLYLSGESGSGKEDAARAFHRASPAGRGPFVAVNCATIPESIAERLLFGAKRGAYSSATTDVGGYVQAADGGTLFLDEVAELQASVQAKLLRLLENREVLPVGAARPVPVDLRVCSASHAPLREQVAAGRLREDLYYRLGRPEITLPPLRERLEEIPWLVECALERHAGALRPHFTFIEACLLRHWPGNVRELLTEVGTALQSARADESLRIEARHLAELAGQPIKPARVRSPALPTAATPDPTGTIVDPTGATSEPTLPPTAALPAPEGAAGKDAAKGAELKRAAIEDVLRRTGGNVSRAAQALGLNRTTLRRLLGRYQIDPRSIPGMIPRDSAAPRKRDG